MKSCLYILFFKNYWVNENYWAVYFDFNGRLKEFMTRTDGSLTYIPISLSAYFRMKPGDAIRMNIQGDGKLYEENYLFWNTQFSGYLVEED